MTDRSDRFTYSDPRQIVVLTKGSGPNLIESNEPQSRSQTSVRYIKNGAGGKWWPVAKTNGQVHTGWSNIPHELLLAHDLSAIRELVDREFGKKPGATQDYNALVCLLDQPSQHIWITFQDGYLWWCTVHDDLEVNKIGVEVERGHFWLTCNRPWSNHSLGGKLLAIADLPGSVTTVAGFKGTVCELKAWQAILRILRDEADLDVLSLDQARADYELAIEKIIKRLGWRDFEQLIDMILIRSGWSRISTLGKTREGIDLEVENLAAREIAFVQVKSAATQAVLDDYIGRFEKRREFYARMIFAVHSPAGSLVVPDKLPVQLWTVGHIAELVVRLGLGTWINRMLA